MKRKQFFLYISTNLYKKGDIINVGHYRLEIVATPRTKCIDEILYYLTFGIRKLRSGYKVKLL